MNHVMTACQNNSLRMNNVSGAMIVAQMDILPDLQLSDETVTVSGILLALTQRSCQDMIVVDR